jgi:hypothetical protein
MEALLTTLLAPVASGRRYWVRAPQVGADGKALPLPYVVMHRISAIRGYTFEGDDGLVQYRVQIDVTDKTYTSATATAAAIVSILSGYQSGAIRGIFVESQRDLPVTDAGDVNHLFRVSTDVIIWHRETA